MNKHMKTPLTLGGLLIRRAKEMPDKPAFWFHSFPDAGPSRCLGLSYGELYRQAAGIGSRLRKTLEQGDRALILCPPGLDYISAFFACQLAGVTAVPAYPPRNAKHMARLEAILADAGTTTVLCLAVQKRQLEEWAHASKELSFCQVDKIASECAGDWKPLAGNPKAIAFLQYTSGTTGSPKGVMVTHRQVVTNLALMDEYFGFRTRVPHRTIEIMCGWVPPYHDMGLVGTILLPLYSGMASHLMTPASFIQKPGRWLKLMSKEKVTITTAPNFAWQLCCNSVSDEEIAALDLTPLRHAVNGAEPIRYETLKDFCIKFGPCGFNPEHFRLVYGMAETVLVNTGQSVEMHPGTPHWQRGVLDSGSFSGKRFAARTRLNLSENMGKEARKIVSCGKVYSSHQLVLAEPETHERIMDGQPGEIWISGPCVASGYWNKPELTEEVFRARLAGDDSGRTWLRTGDLGTLIDGELYVLGRIKEMVIVRGQNHYAVDLEITANDSSPLLGHDRTIAFGVEDEGGEQLVLVHELNRSALRRFDPNALARAMRRAVLEAHEIDVATVVFIRPATLPRTTSGKLQRTKARQQFKDGMLTQVARWEAAGDVSVLSEPGVIRRLGGLDPSTEIPSGAAVGEQLSDVPGMDEARAFWCLEADGQVQLRVAVARGAEAPSRIGDAQEGNGRMRFGLFFFGSDDPETGEESGYDLLLKAADIADDAGLEAVWTPERHFGQFGGHYPSP
ncbi:fatty acyl-AMP ligase, partial [Roseibium sp. RKSG952]|uniref:fatty acyl-AMP ligase n=1 Tax=Roseibium sp. RKSG952 TaxID=2529384 RepID=UPI0012BB796B